MLLSPSEIEARLKEFPAWKLLNEQLLNEQLVRDFEFKNFSEAFGFMAAVACVAESLFHHPDWSNVYNKVSIAITTHSEGGITELDFKFVNKVDELALTFLNSS